MMIACFHCFHDQFQELIRLKSNRNLPKTKMDGRGSLLLVFYKIYNSVILSWTEKIFNKVISGKT